MDHYWESKILLNTIANNQYGLKKINLRIICVPKQLKGLLKSLKYSVKFGVQN